MNDEVERDAPADVVSDARLAVDELSALLKAVGADRPTATPEMLVQVIPGDDTSLRRLVERHRGDETWVYFTVGEGIGVAFPINPRQQARGVLPGLLLMPVHTRLTAWWLVQAWRVEELSRGALEAWQGGRPVGAALGARGLLETAAVLHHDADRLEAAWHRVKTVGPPRVGADTIGLGELFDVVNMHEFGGVFSDELADLKEALARFKRRSVLTDVGKLARQLSPELQELYEWLSNVAHPSFGTMIAYSSPMHVHPTGTHSVRVVAGDPGCAELVALRSTRQSRIDSVGGMTVRAVALGCRYAAVTLDRALRTVDDLGLTSSAAKAAPWQYWRALEPAARNARCPCRAARKAKACGHEWGLPAPGLGQLIRATPQGSWRLGRGT